MLRKEAVLLVGCLLLWGGCAPVGPNHQTPAMKLPPAFSQGGVTWRASAGNATPQPRAWWRLYGDSTLNFLVERTLGHNQQLEAAAARVDQARIMSRQSRSLFFPGIDLGASGDRTKFRFRGPGGGSSIANNFVLPVDLDYELDVWGKVRRQVEASDATAAASKETFHAMQLTMAAEVAQTYWALCAVDADRAILARAVDLRRRALELLRKQKDAGAISGLDFSRAETEVESAEADRIGLERQRVDLVNAIAVLTGTAATGTQIGENRNLPAPPSIPATIPSELLRQRPDIRAAERTVAARNAGIGAATAAFYPSFKITGSVGFDSPELKNLVSSDSLVWALGQNLTLPLTGQAYLRLERDRTVAAHREASADYRQTVLQAISEVESALQATSILARRQSAQEAALASATRTFSLSEKRFKGGLVSFLDVVDAERTRLENERAVNAVRAERLAVSVSLAKAVGGEWR